MAYFTKVLQPGETVRYQGRLHWIVYGPGLALLVGGVVAGLFLLNSTSTDDQSSASGNFLIVAAMVCCVLVALSLLFSAWINRVTTEIVVTDRRVLFKTGLIGRRTAEMNVSKVETVDVQQGVLGRMLGFGTVLVRGTGAGLEPLRRIAEPIALRNSIAAG